MTAHQRASDIRRRLRSAYAGQVVEDPRNIKRDAFNGSANVAQTTTWEVTNADADGTIDLVGVGDAISDLADYTFAFDVNLASTTLTAAGIADAFNEDPDARDFGTMSSSGAYITLTAHGAGAEFAFTATKTSSQLGSATTVSAADPVAVPFARAIFGYRVAAGTAIPSLNGDGHPNRSGALMCALPGTSAVPFEVQTITVGGTAEDAKVVTVHVHRGGQRPKSESFTFTTATSSTTTTIAAQIAAALNTSSLGACTSSGAVATFTANERGMPLTITVHEVTTSTATYAVEVSTSTSDAQELLLGVATYEPTMIDSDTLGQAASEWPANEGLVYLEEGFINVAISAVPARGTSVYVGTASGEEGKIYSSAATGRVLWARARFTGDGADGLAVVHLRPAA